MGHSLRHGVYHMLCRIHGVGMACHCAESEPIGGMMASLDGDDAEFRDLVFKLTGSKESVEQMCRLTKSERIEALRVLEDVLLWQITQRRNDG